MEFNSPSGVTTGAFTNCYNEAIHVEDYSSRVNIESNKFTACGLNQGSYIQIISASNAINVSNNQIDGTANANFIAVFNFLAGGRERHQASALSLLPRISQSQATRSSRAG